MNTITIDNNTYNSIVRYAQLNNISVSEAVVTGLNSFLEKFKEKVSTKEKYYISPEVKALEVGFECPQDLSDDYRKEHVYNGKSEYFEYKDLEDGKKYNLNEIDLNILHGEYFMMATTTYRTEVLRASGLKMLEKTFYVDMQYNIVPITKVDTFAYYHLDIYRYFIGRKDQSMNMDNFVRNQEHHKRMIKWLIEYYTGIEKDLTPNKREYIEMILTYTLNTHYSIYCEYDKDHKRAYNEIREFDAYLKKTNQRLYDRLNCMAYVRYNRETQFKFVKVDGSKWHKVMVLARKVKGRFAR